MTTASPPVAVPQGLEAPIDPSALARMASALFAALPGTPPSAVPGVGQTTPIAGVQAPVNIAPPGSPLASPAGLGPSVPGTPIPQGTIPGANLLPASPTPVASLVHRAPALLPHAPAGNGVPDKAFSALPGYEPRFGGAVLGVPEASGAVPYYFLDTAHGQLSAGGADPARASSLDLLARQPFSTHTEPPRAAGAPTGADAVPAAPSGDPRFYFVDALVLPSGFVTPPKPGARDAVPLAGQGQHPPFDVHAIRRDFPVLSERVNGRQLVWFDNAATTHKPRQVIDRISYFYEHENSNIHRAAHELAARATDAYEGARQRVQKFINAPDVN